MGNERVQYKACAKCKDLFIPESKQLIIFSWKETKFIEVCRKCKEKE